MLSIVDCDKDSSDWRDVSHSVRGYKKFTIKIKWDKFYCRWWVIKSMIYFYHVEDKWLKLVLEIKTTTFSMCIHLIKAH